MTKAEAIRIIRADLDLIEAWHAAHGGSLDAQQFYHWIPEDNEEVREFLQETSDFYDQAYEALMLSLDMADMFRRVRAVLDALERDS
jgi:hypothetical protein